MIHPFEALALPDPDDRLRGAKGDATFPLGPIDLGDFIDFYNPRWCVHGPDDSGNKGSGCVSTGLQPSFPAI